MSRTTKLNSRLSLTALEGCDVPSAVMSMPPRPITFPSYSTVPANYATPAYNQPIRTAAVSNYSPVQIGMSGSTGSSSGSANDVWQAMQDYAARYGGSVGGPNFGIVDPNAGAHLEYVENLRNIPQLSAPPSTKSLFSSANSSSGAKFTPFIGGSLNLGPYSLSYSTASGFGFSRNVNSLSNFASTYNRTFSVGPAQGSLTPTFSGNFSSSFAANPVFNYGYGFSIGPHNTTIQGSLGVGLPSRYQSLSLPVPSASVNFGVQGANTGYMHWLGN